MIAIVDYKMGNIGSILNMFKKIGVEATITADREIISNANGLVLPGVGAFDGGMNNLKNLKLLDVLQEAVLEKKKPVLGICLGMQLLFDSSEEGRAKGLGWISGECLKFPNILHNEVLKVPHIGWNYIDKKENHPLLEGADADTRFYFVHSYYVKSAEPDAVLAASEYGLKFDSIVAKDNVMGVQFHPEKSHRYGMELLKNFSNIVG